MINLTILLVYISASILLFKSHWQRHDTDTSTSFGGIAGASVAMLGFAIHSFAIFQNIFVNGVANLNVANSVSLVAWQVALFAIISATKPALRGLSSILILLVAIALVITLLDSNDVVVDVSGWQVQSHIMLSIFSYSLLSIAALLGLCLAYQDRQFKQAKMGGSMRILPPMETTEKTFFSAVVAGFSLLSLAIFSGLVFVEDLKAQHLTHKTILSIASWFIFGVLIFGRLRFGWRRKAVYWTLTAVVLLGLAFLGSKFVLEVLLNKRWG